MVRHILSKRHLEKKKQSNFARDNKISDTIKAIGFNYSIVFKQF